MLELIVHKPLHIELRNGPTPEKPGTGEVKIKVHLGGICGSDLALYLGKFTHATFPIRAGHELIGTIIEKGDDVPYSLGTRVALFPNTFCGNCEFCLQGKTNICEDKQSLGINKDGGFAEQLIVPAKYVIPIPDDLPDEVAVLVEPFAVALSAMKKVTIKENMQVAVVGLGNIGLLIALLANYFGAKVTAIEPNENKHQLIAKISGIEARYPEQVSEQKFDIVFEAAGTETAVQKAISVMKKGGSLVLIGMVNEVTLPIVQIVRNDQTIYGSIIYKYPDDFTETMNYLSKLQPIIQKLNAKIVPLEKYKEAYAMAQSGDYTKVVLDFTRQK